MKKKLEAPWFDTSVWHDEAVKREEIAKAMTAYQTRNGNAIRNIVSMSTERWIADWANRTGYRLMAHERFRASVEVSHAAIIAHQR